MWRILCLLRLLILFNYSNVTLGTDRSLPSQLKQNLVQHSRCVSCIPAQIPIASGNSLTAKYAPDPERSTVFVNRVWEQFYDTLYYIN